MKMRSQRLTLAMCVIAASASQLAYSEDEKTGFVEGSKFSVLNRNFYFNRDNRDGPAPGGAGYSEAWAQAVIAKFQSGFTEGIVGFGVDAFAMLGLKLDSGNGRSGGRSSFDVLPVSSNGEVQDEYTKVGGALKARAFDTTLAVGDVFPTTPVVAFGDSRLLPESFSGFTVSNASVEGLTIQGGRLHAMSQPVSSDTREQFATFYAGPVNSPWMGYFGGEYTVNNQLAFSAYGGRLKDAWDQKYFGTTFTQPLSDGVTLIAGFNYYNAKDEGRRLLGEFNNNIWSGKLGVQFGAHTVAVSHQQNHGNNDFDYLRQADSIYLDNSIQYSDFNSPKEKSWMVRYDLDMKTYGIPGLTFMTRYGKGTGADYSNANSVYMRRDDNGDPLTNQKRWERDIEVKYVVQSGDLKDMSFRIRQATTRATQFESDLDEFRLIVEYPMRIF